MVDGCYLAGHGSCRAPLTGEHFISRCVLEYSSNTRAANIGGLPWQPPNTLQQIGISSLESKILCDGHNSRLSYLDQVGLKMQSTLDAIDKRPDEIPALTQISGVYLERWLLKVLAGMTAGPNKRAVPESWKRLLVGGIWPDGWGLYVPEPEGAQIFANDFGLETLVHPETRDILAGRFFIAGVSVSLLVGRPDWPSVYGKYRPRGFIFNTDSGDEKRVELLWPHHTNEAIICTRHGPRTPEGPAHRNGWIQQEPKQKKPPK